MDNLSKNAYSPADMGGSLVASGATRAAQEWAIWPGIVAVVVGHGGCMGRLARYAVAPAVPGVAVTGGAVPRSPLAVDGRGTRDISNRRELESDSAPDRMFADMIGVGAARADERDWNDEGRIPRYLVSGCP